MGARPQYCMLRKHELTLGFLFVYALACLPAGVAHAQELVKDINPTPESQLKTDTDFSERCKPCGDYLYFVGRDKEHGEQIWRTDGTEEGTIRISGDHNELGGSSLSEFTLSSVCLDGKLYLGYAGIWRSGGAPGDLEKVETGLYPDVFQGKIAFVLGNEVRLTTGEPNSSTVITQFEAEEGDAAIGIVGLKATIDHLFTIINHIDENGISTKTDIWAFDGTTNTKVFESPRSIPWQVLASAGDKLYFPGWNEDSGWEPWASDGTIEGTEILVETVPGANDSAPSFNGVVNDKVVITIRDPSSNTWISEGTPATTELLFADFAANYMKIFHDKLYFSGNPLIGSNLTVIRTDLDLTGVEVVVPEYLQHQWGGYFSIAGDKLLYGYDDPTNGIEVFVIDEDNLSMSLLTDINPGTASSSPRSFGEIGSRSIFLADDGEHGFEFWVTDGTEAGTVMLKELAPGTQSPEMSEVYQYNKKLYFIAKSTNADNERQVWTSNGTEAGTYSFYEDPALSKDMLFGVNNYVITTANGFVKIDLDAEDNTALNLPPGYTNYVEIHTQPELNVGDIVFFNTAAGTSPETTGGLELWTADVSTNDITFVKDINPGPAGSVIYSERPKFNGMGVTLNDKIIFPAVNGDGMEPWASDGTEEGTVQLMNIRGSGDSFPRSFTVMDDKVFFIALSDTEGTELWVTDGTPEGTHIVKDIAPGDIDGILNEPLAVYADRLFFIATSDGTEDKLTLWTTDGTEEGTAEYDQLLPEDWKVTSNLIAVGDYLYFFAFNQHYGNELWSTDGTAEGTTLLELTPGAEGSYIDDFVNGNGTLFFSTHGKIWRSVGTPETTVFLGEANPVGELMLTDDYLCFQLEDPDFGKELFRVSLTGPVGQLITFTGFINLKPGQEYDIEVNASSGLPVTLTSSDPSVIEIDGNKIIVHKAGAVTFTATQGGDIDFKSTTETLSVVIEALPQTITFEPIVSKTMLDESFSVEASTTSELTLTYESSDASIAEIDAEGMITIKKAGTVTITVSQEGNEIYNAAEPVSRIFTISKVSQSITFSPIETKTVGSGSFELTATASSGLPVSYTFTGTNIDIDGTTVELLGAGKVSITAQQAGNNVYNAADGVIREFCVNPAKPTVTETIVGVKVTLTSSAATNVWLHDNVQLTFTGKSFDATAGGFYKAAEVVGQCQGEFSDAVTVVITGLEELANFSVYPNPVKDRLFISAPAHVRLLDVNGREHISESINEYVNVAPLTPGVYILIVNNTQRLKIIKQ